MKVLDPAIGKGIFFHTLIPLFVPLIASVKLYGIDIDPSVIKTADQVLSPLVSGSSYKIELKCRNFFLDFPTGNQSEEYDIIIGNPPHNARYSQPEWKNIRKNCNYGKNKKIRSESSTFFTLLSLDILKPGGILCFLLPKPIIYSKRWKEFRKIIFTKYKLVEVIDLGNQFPGQLQEQCTVIIKKQLPSLKKGVFQTGVWNPVEKKIKKKFTISISDALIVDNLLVGVKTEELDIIRRIYGNGYDFLDVVAFRGLSSKYRTRKGTIPLIEKASVGLGFLLPARSFLKENTPKKSVMRQQTPKVIAQRIISYQTKPSCKFDLKLWVDQEGTFLTHETVVNIIPKYSQNLISLSAIAGLLKSSFIEWWLRHAIYTKYFATSKDFDKKYISLIRIPRTPKSRRTDYCDELMDLLRCNQYKKLMIELKSLSILDKFFALGEIYTRFQNTGNNLKDQITHLIKNKSFQVFFQNKTEFEIFRWCNRQFIKEMEDDRIIQGSRWIKFQSSKEIKSIKIIYDELLTLQDYMDEIVFSLYRITTNEKMVIKGES